MLLAALQQVDKAFNQQVILRQATLELHAGARVALIGRNGAGKSTILALLAGELTPDAGTVYRREGVAIGKLEQAPTFPPQATVLELAEAAFSELAALEAKLTQLERQLADPQAYARWEALHATFERRGGYARRARRDAVLAALGFRGREQQLAASLSGGEATRLGLAQLLMAQPDVLLLDEPTNHLDLEMRSWLEGYLARYPGAVLLVSHDRALLEGACEATAEIAGGALRSFAGPPSAYLAQRATALRQAAHTRKQQLRERERLAAAAERLQRWGGQNAGRAQALKRRLARHEATMLPEAEPEARTLRFSFAADDSGELVLEAAHLSKRLGGRQLFRDVGVTLRRRERIALVGPNGAGKSTLLKLLVGELASDDPRAHVRYGSRVRLGYYDQQLRGVNPEHTLFEELRQLVDAREAHNLLGRFLFPFEAQYKRIAELSGGERARLALLKLSLGGYNLLVLDEPTNHLDLEMIGALEAALAAYAGALIVVSHDRRFIEAIAERIWELDGGRFTAYQGGWRDYQRRRAAQAQAAAPMPPTPPPPKRSGPSKWQRARQREALEREISALEAELAELAARLSAPAALSSAEIAKLAQQHAAREAALLEKMAAWEALAEA